jgi:hypothetical protein
MFLEKSNNNSSFLDLSNYIDIDFYEEIINNKSE